jgi:hydrogenase nickel incorporation protein HypA/HybF
MHELSIAQEIISIIEDEMARHNLKGVKEVKVRVGALSGISPDALSFGFEAATMDSSLSETKLLIEEIPACGKCLACGRIVRVDDFVFLCPYCDSRNLEITKGEELDVAYLVEK